MDRDKLKEEEKKELEKKVQSQIESHNKLLRKIFLGVAFLMIIFIIVYFFMQSTNSFEYKGIDVEIEKYCDAKPCLTFYKVSIPVSYTDGVTGNIVEVDYNIYLRNDPRDLEEVPVNGEIVFRKNMVLSLDSENLFCDGHWPISIANLQKLNVFGINFIAKNESEFKLYLPKEEYMNINIKEADKTGIEQIDEFTYDLNVGNCEILDATERLIIEAFVQSIGDKSEEI